jgi:amino acid transporter
LIATHHVIPETSVPGGANNWAQAMVLLVFAYGGFEAALVSAGEAKDPRRDMPFGLFAGLITCAILYGLIQWVVVGVLPDPGHSQRPLADVARIVMGRGGAAVIAGGALFSVYGYLRGNMLGTPRITFALAERGDFPSFLARVHPRFHTPYSSILVFAVLVWLLALFGSFAGNATLSAGSRLFYYGVICAALPILRRKLKAPAGYQLRGGSSGSCICELAGSAKENFLETLRATSLLPARLRCLAEVEKLEPQSALRDPLRSPRKPA